MRATLTKALFIGLTAASALAGTPSRAGAQAHIRAADEASRAVSTVMDYRRTYLDDTLPFEACTVRRVLGVGAGDFVTRLVSHVRGMLDDAESPCPRPPTRGRHVVLVDSLQLTDSIAQVHLTVIRGELIHREAYVLSSASTAVYMGVREVKLWGHSQAYPARPSRN